MVYWRVGLSLACGGMPLNGGTKRHGAGWLSGSGIWGSCVVAVSEAYRADRVALMSGYSTHCVV